MPLSELVQKRTTPTVNEADEILHCFPAPAHLTVPWEPTVLSTEVEGGGAYFEVFSNNNWFMKVEYCC